MQGKEKTVIYWLAELKDPNTPVVMSAEHQAFKWLPQAEAADLGNYQEMRDLIKSADEFLRSKFVPK